MRTGDPMGRSVVPAARPVGAASAAQNSEVTVTARAVRLPMGRREYAFMITAWGFVELIGEN
jgi:hypothetical protein